MEVLEAVRRFQQSTTALAQDDSSWANAVGDDGNADNDHLTGSRLNSGIRIEAIRPETMVLYNQAMFYFF